MSYQYGRYRTAKRDGENELDRVSRIFNVRANKRQSLHNRMIAEKERSLYELSKNFTLLDWLKIDELYGKTKYDRFVPLHKVDAEGFSEVEEELVNQSNREDKIARLNYLIKRCNDYINETNGRNK